MIRFVHLRFKNFFATGNIWTEIDFEASRSTIIVGINGSGKSTFIDALCYVLYGKPFRNINKPLLINTITQKEMVVEVIFYVNNTRYYIRRGQKPNLFEIYRGEEGKLIDQTTGVIEYQDMLEKQILKMNFKSFIQLVILGSTNYVPFMRLTAQGRREVIEDILDIQVFSLMNKLLKEKIDQNKQVFTETNFKIELCQNKIKMNRRHLEALKQKDDSYIAFREQNIKAYQEQIEQIKSIILSDFNAFTISKNDCEVLEKEMKKLNEYISFQKSFYKKINNGKQDLETFKTLINCPTCGQPFDNSFLIAKKEDVLNELEKAKTEIDEKLKDYNSVSLRLEEVKAATSKYDKAIAKNEIEIYSITTLIQSLQEEISKCEQERAEPVSNEDFETELKQLSETKAQLLEDRELYAAATILLKDGGIKTKIVQQYIPVMNECINKYLEAMDFFVGFYLDENFNETIKSRYRDEFVYESFSEGQKQRINLAILFAWLEIAKLRNSASCNLLIMDEILDGCLDFEGTETFMKLLQEIMKTRNIIIISHRWNMLEKFERTIEFKLEKNFSRIA